MAEKPTPAVEVTCAHCRQVTLARRGENYRCSCGRTIDTTNLVGPTSSAPAGFFRVKIVSPDPVGHRAKVTVDGVEPEHLTRVDLKLEVDALTTVVLHHHGPSVDFEGLARVVHVPPTLEERVRRALDRVKGGGAAMRIPADPSDFDLVLTDVLTVLELARQTPAPPLEAPGAGVTDRG